MSEPVVAELVTLLRKECAAARAFLALLEEERDALTRGAVDNLSQITDAKAEAARNLAALTAERERPWPLTAGQVGASA